MENLADGSYVAIRFGNFFHVKILQKIKNFSAGLPRLSMSIALSVIIHHNVNIFSRAVD